MKKILLISILGVLLVKPYTSFSQTDGDFRSLKHGGGWASSGTFEFYTSSTDSWASSSTAPIATTNVTILDGVGQTSNGNGYVAASLTIGNGNAFAGIVNLAMDTVTSVTITNPGKLMANPGVAFVGAGTTLPTASLTFKSMGTYYKNKGTGYTTATVTIGSNWAPKVAYAVGQQRINGGNLYTVSFAGTSSYIGGPTGTGAGISDSTVVWNYSGIAATAHAVIDGGKITDIIIDTPGSGYIASGASLPAVSITGDGTGASYGHLMGVASVIITKGGSYTVAPKIVIGTSFQCGNSGTARTVTINGDVTFKTGATMINGGGSVAKIPTLMIGGNLITETPISFIGVYPASTSYTIVNFTKAGTATISGADSCVFVNLNIGASTIVEMNSTNNYIGTANQLGTLTIEAGGSLVLASGKTLTINGYKVTGPYTFNSTTTGLNNLGNANEVKVTPLYSVINVFAKQNYSGKVSVYTIDGKKITDKLITSESTDILKPNIKGMFIVKIELGNGSIITRKILSKE